MKMEYRKVFIYKITNNLGKIYIGSTLNIKDRIYRYKTARLGKQFKIKNSILKYGWENHLFEIIFECNESDRNKYESYYGYKFDVLGANGLNLSLPKGDIPGYTMSEETKIKIGLLSKGKIINDIQKKAISNSLKKTINDNGHWRKNLEPWNKGKSFLKAEKNPMYGVRRSQEWKNNHSILMKSKSIKSENHPSSKIVYDTYTGVYYFSLKELSALLNINYSTFKSKLNGSIKNDTRYIYA